jgi:Abortive infection C-terminus
VPQGAYTWEDLARFSDYRPGSTALPSLFKEALDATGAAAAQADVGRSLAATLQRLAEHRNAFGAGHGRASQPEVRPAAARLAASAATGIALFLLAPEA